MARRAFFEACLASQACSQTRVVCHAELTHLVLVECCLPETEAVLQTFACQYEVRSWAWEQDHFDRRLVCRKFWISSSSLNGECFDSSLFVVEEARLAWNSLIFSFLLCGPPSSVPFHASLFASEAHVFVEQSSHLRQRRLDQF